MLNGIDISHHNFYMKDIHDLNQKDFVIMKATEGIRFRDNKMPLYMKVLSDQMLYGFYHFARPDLGNNPEDEAANFLKYVKPYLTDRCLLALDVEAGALAVKDIDKWCAIFMQVCDLETGKLPLLYCSQDECKRFKAVAALGCGLWVAKWGKKPTEKQIKPWDFWAIWQYTDSDIFSGQRVDCDKFNGSYDQFLKYCKGE